MIPINAVLDKLVNTDTYIKVRSEELLDFINRVNCFQHNCILGAIIRKDSEFTISKNNDLFKLYALLMEDKIGDKYIKLDRTASGKINIEFFDGIPDKIIEFDKIANPEKTPADNFYKKLFDITMKNIYNTLNMKLKG